MLVAVSVINATLRQAIKSETAGLAGSATLQVLPGGATPLPATAITVAQRTPGVRAAVPALRIISRLNHAHVSKPLLIFGVATNLTSLFPEGLGDVSHQLTSAAVKRGGILLTPQLAATLRLQAGDAIAVETPGGRRTVRVAAVLHHNPVAALNGGVFALMSLSASQTLFERDREVSTIYVASDPGVSTSGLRSLLQRRLGTGAAVERPGAEDEAYERTFGTLSIITEEARTVGLLVALFLVINTMAMAAAERRVETALMLTLGVKRWQVVTAFFVEAGILGLVGASIGVTAGTVLAHLLIQRAVESYNVLPVTVSGALAMPSVAVVAGLAGGFSTSILGAAIATRQILNATPIDALRPEASYEWPIERRRRGQKMWAVGGVCAIALSALSAVVLPIGSDQRVFALAAIFGLTGALLVMPLGVPIMARIVRRMLHPWLRVSGKAAVDELVRSPGRTTVTAGGIAVAAAFVIAVGSGIGAFRFMTIESAERWYQAPLYVNLEGATSYIINQPLPASASRELEGVKGVKALYPMRYGLINAHGYQVLIEAMPVAEAAARGDYIMSTLGIERRNLVKALARGEVLISRLTARHYKLAPGEIFRLPTTRGLATIKIGGLFNDLASFDSVLVEHSVYERLSGDTLADRFAVVTQPGASDEVVKRGLQRRLNKLGIAATVFTSREMAQYLVKSISGLFSLAQGIEVAALIVAGLIVLSTMSTASLEQRHELGIKRLLGMSRRQLGSAVIFEGAAISVVGAIGAAGLGLGLGWLITLSMENQLAWAVPFRPAAALLLGAIAVTICTGAVAALYPAWLATRSRIVDALRDE
jgi:putative ABC transport system permease protein